MANEKRLIDANALQFKPEPVDNIMNGVLFVRGRGVGKTVAMVSEALKCMIDNAPTVDAVEVVHGRWLSAYEYAQKLGVTDKEKLEEAKADKWWKFCNDCEQQVKGFHNYCPNCGAKMDGGNEDG